MAFTAPPNSRRQVDLAGDRIRSGTSTAADVTLLEQWRASHLYVINTFQSRLRDRRRRHKDDVSIAQRLKRRPTIVDKLQREPGMALSRMHDIAGLRLIFDDVSDLQAFRAGFHNSRAEHELIGGDDRYDYLTHPKRTGYRGIHDVYRYKVGSAAGQAWNGLRLEIQYRTVVQHAWATAVEISDIVNATRLKFGGAAADLERVFLLTSELLARAHEETSGYCKELDDKTLIGEFMQLEKKTGAIDRLRQLSSSQFTTFAKNSRLFILINFFPEVSGQALLHKALRTAKLHSVNMPN